jgi:hypothetical protein
LASSLFTTVVSFAHWVWWTSDFYRKKTHRRSMME